MSETTESEGHVYRYHATCHWAGDTAIGYDSFDRAHLICPSGLDRVDAFG